MALVARPLTGEDLERLSALERRHLADHGGEPLVSAAALGLYGRSGHAFVVERGGEPVGFVLGRAVWDGRRATLTAQRLAVADPGDIEAIDALLAALTKSAYDAGVYRLELRLDAGAQEAIERGIASGFRPAPITLLTRILGSGQG